MSAAAPSSTYTGEPVLVGVIGGSGVYNLSFLENATRVSLETPFGAPSDELLIATVGTTRCVFLPRHGRSHSFTPSEVPYRANLYAFKMLGVKYVISINAVGSLHEDYKPGDLVLVDQLIDKTFARKTTFFDNGIVAHVPFGHPTSIPMRDLAYATMAEEFKQELSDKTFQLHKSGTLVTMEGPQFSTRAESLLNRATGAHLIGMTSATEAKLAREAEMAYLIVAMVTDMDAWSDIPHVDVSTVMKTMQDNLLKAQRYPPAIIRAIGENPVEDPEAFNALQYGVMTKPHTLSEEIKKRVAALLHKYPQFA